MIDILSTRLHNHLLWYHDSTLPHGVVQHFLCIQSQDRNQHLRAIASRAWCSQDDIIRAYNDWLIVRNWTQRGTIHVVASVDVVWMTKLCATKTLSSFTRRKEYLGIDDNQYDRALKHLQDYLISGPKLRKDIGAYLAQSWIDVKSGLLYNILCFAGSSGLVVQWPIINGEQAFVLTSSWIKNSKRIDSDTEAVRELCLRYFSSHGPATIEDLQRWSGLGKTVLKQGIADCGEELQSFEYEGKVYYTSASSWAKRSGAEGSQKKLWDVSMPLRSTQHDAPLSKNLTVHFLAWFDERLLGYKDRSATVHTDHLNRIDVSRNGVFKPTVMIDGETIGIWSIKHKAKVSEITVTWFDKLSDSVIELLQQAVSEYSQYIAKEVKLSIV